MADQANEFEDAAAGVMQAQTANIRNNVYNAVTQNPAQVAQHAQIAQSLGVPLGSVQSDPTAAKQQAAMQSFDANKVVAQYPHLAQFLSDPTNAAKSHNDLPTLAATEQAVKTLPQPAPASAPPALEPSRDNSFVANVGSIPDLPMAALQGYAYSFNRAAKAINMALGGFPVAYDRLASLMTGTYQSDVSDAYFKRFVQPLDEGATAFQLSPNATTLQKTVHGVGGLAGTLVQIAATGGMSETPVAIDVATPVLTSMAAKFAHAAKSMAFPSITAAVNTGNDVYQNTGSMSQAVKAASTAYATNTAMGVLPLSVEGNLATRLATGFPVGALTGEVNRQVTNASLPVGMQNAPSVEDTIINGLTGSILAGTMGAAPNVHEAALRQAYQENVKADQATQSMQGLQALGELAKTSELRKNDPAAFRDFVQKVTEDGHLPEVWVDGQTLVDALNQSKVSLDELKAKMPDVANQLTEALQTKGDVRISTADYTTNIAGSAMEPSLLPHLKTDPDGMTFQQGQDHLAQQQTEMQQQAQDIADKQAALDQRQQQLKMITDDVQQQLEATGRFPSDVAKQYAALHGAFYDTMSERMGIEPAEMKARMPLAIKAEGRGGLSQGEANRGFYNPATGEMGLLKDADLSTFLHESGHYFLEAMHDFASHSEAPAGVKGDFDTLLQHFGVKGETPEARMQDWSSRTLNDQRDGHEKFAEDFENYLMSGEAPTPELQSMFSRFRSWLMNVYHSLRGEVSPEVRGVMDRMFASQEAIHEAERVRAYAMPDLSSEHGALIDEYKTLGHEATEQAIADMQARSLRDLKWASNAKSRALKELQRSAKDERAKITDEVTKDVTETPVNKARTWLTKGETTDANGATIKAEKGFKLNSDELKTMFPKGELGATDLASLKGMTAKDGLHPDLVADMFGFNSGKELVGALIHSEKPADQIKGLTDQRMLERHGDLIDPVSIERAAEAAIHNEVRARMMATGLKMFTRSPMSSVEINKAAKAAADTAIAQKNVGDLRPSQYSAAEAKANKELLKLAPKDPMGAAQAQRAALLNNRLFKSSSEAVADVRKGLTYLKRFSRDAARAKIDVDIRDQIDDILARFDLRANPTDAPTRAQKNLQEWVDSQVAAGMMPSVTPEMLSPAFRKPYRDMTVEQFRGMVDTVRSLEETGKNRNNITINGERQELSDYVNTRLIPKIKEAGEKFSPEELYTRPEDRGISQFAVGLDHASSWLRSVGAELKPQAFKRNFFDKHEILGPFGEAIFEPIHSANYDKVKMLDTLSKSFRKKAEELGKDWQKSLNEPIENTLLKDNLLSEQLGKDVMMKLTRGRMLMLALHSGNESNFDKLTKGYGWDGADVWKLLSDNMSAKDIDAVNHIHEMYESHWPDMVKLYRDMGQTAPPKIEARETELPNGKLTGGYAHIDYDPLRSRYGQKAGEGQAKEIAANGVSVGDYFKRTGTTNGAMNARVEGYTDAINLDFHTIERALQETIHDLAYRRALVDTNKILEHPDFKREFQKAYGPENLQALHTWLGRVANANNADLNASKLSRVLQYSRTGMVMNAIALRITTVVKHGGSAAFKSLGYMVGGGEKYFGKRLAAMFHDYTNQTQSAIQKFDEIHARALQQDRDYRATASSMFEPESAQSKAERFGHAAVAYSDLFTAVPTAWAAYDRAITVGIPKSQGGTGKPMTEAQAVAYANQMVREAHGSQIESARSNIMTEPGEAMKMFTTLYGFMNNSYGQLTDIASKLTTTGISKPEVLARALMAIVVPSLWIEAALGGGKHDDESWAEWSAKAIAGEVASSVPFVRDAVSMVHGFSHAGQVGVESWLQTMVQAGHDVAKAAEGKGDQGKPIQDVANALGEGLHIPGLGQIGKTAQYQWDLHHGKAPTPEGTPRDNQVVNSLIGAPKKK